MVFFFFFSLSRNFLDLDAIILRNGNKDLILICFGGFRVYVIIF